MILGDRCTRDCRFCNVIQAPPAKPDPSEPQRVAAAVAELGLNHAVITSVTRDDLADGGARQFAEVTRKIRDLAPDCRIELLIPDLQGDSSALRSLLEAAPDLVGHNLETVPRLYAAARQGADYQRSLALLRTAAILAPKLPTKTGLMLGMGETWEEILAVMRDILETGCYLLTLGQYLQPSRRHLEVVRYLPPAEFRQLQQVGRNLGFRHIEAGPLVRSSYHAAEQFEESTDEKSERDL